MISAAELLRAFDGDHVAHGLHHADHILAAHRVGTDGTDIGIGHIMTALAEADLLAHLQNNLSESLRGGGFLAKEMEHQPQGGLLPDTGQFGEFVHRRFQQSRRKLHRAKLQTNIHFIVPVGLHRQLPFDLCYRLRLAVLEEIAGIPNAVLVVVVEDGEVVIAGVEKLVLVAQAPAEGMAQYDLAALHEKEDGMTVQVEPLEAQPQVAIVFLPLGREGHRIDPQQLLPQRILGKILLQDQLVLGIGRPTVDQGHFLCRRVLFEMIAVGRNIHEAVFQELHFRRVEIFNGHLEEELELIVQVELATTGEVGGDQQLLGFVLVFFLRLGRRRIQQRLAGCFLLARILVGVEVWGLRVFLQHDETVGEGEDLRLRRVLMRARLILQRIEGVGAGREMGEPVIAQAVEAGDIMGAVLGHGRIVEVAVQHHDQGAVGLAAEGHGHSAGELEGIDIAARGKSISEMPEYIALVIIAEGVAEIEGIGSIGLERVFEVYGHRLQFELHRRLDLRHGKCDQFLARVFQVDILIEGEHDLIALEMQGIQLWLRRQKHGRKGILGTARGRDHIGAAGKARKPAKEKGRHDEGKEETQRFFHRANLVDRRRIYKDL